MSRESGNAPPVRNKLLFVDGDGNPITFVMRPGAEKQILAPLVKEYGGIVTSRDTNENAIRLAGPQDKTTRPENFVKIRYVKDCIKFQKLLDIEEYRCLHLSPRKKQPDAETDKSSERSHPLSEHNPTSHKRQHNAPGPMKVSYVGRIKFTNRDDEDMIKFLQRTRRSKIGGDVVWKDMERNKVTRHTWQAMKDRVKKYVLPRIHTFDFLTEADIKWFKNSSLGTSKKEKLNVRDIFFPRYTGGKPAPAKTAKDVRGIPRRPRRYMAPLDIQSVGNAASRGRGPPEIEEMRSSGSEISEERSYSSEESIYDFEDEASERGAAENEAPGRVFADNEARERVLAENEARERGVPEDQTSEDVTEDCRVETEFVEDRTLVEEESDTASYSSHLDPVDTEEDFFEKLNKLAADEQLLTEVTMFFEYMKTFSNTDTDNAKETVA